MDELQAELLGMHAGDGTLYRTSSKGLVWELRGGHDEHEYYGDVVVPLFERIFSISLKPHPRTGGGHGSYGVRCCKREVTEYLAQFFPVGSKSRTVRIPKEIMDSCQTIQCAFLRGLFDTDGCFRLDKNGCATPRYPKIEFGTVSSLLHVDVVSLLHKLGIKYHCWKNRDSYCLCMSGWKNLSIWMNKIGFHNPAV